MSQIVNAFLRMTSIGYRNFRYIFLDDDVPPWQAQQQGYQPLSGFSQHEFEDFAHSFSAIRLCMFHGVLYFSFAVLGFSFLVENWSIVDSLYFATVVFTTIGYGDMAPNSHPARLYTVFLSLYGIVILGIFLGVIGEMIVEYHNAAADERKQRHRQKIMEKLRADGTATVERMVSVQEDSQGPRTIWNVIWSIVLLELPIVAVLLLVALWVGYMEGWSIVGSVYWLVVTGTTVGFGDYHPTLPSTRIFCIFFLPVAVAVLGELLARIASAYMDRKRRQKELEFLSRSMELCDLQVMDTDENGRVDRAEFMTYMLVALHKVSKEDIREIRDLFDKIDVDGNGAITLDDLRAQSWEATMRQSMRDMFN